MTHIVKGFGIVNKAEVGVIGGSEVRASASNPSQHQSISVIRVVPSVYLILLYQRVLIPVSEVIDIPPGNLDSSLCFIQPGISHDVLYI